MSERNSIGAVGADSINALSGRTGVGAAGRRNGTGTAGGRPGEGAITDRTRIRERNDHDAATVLAVVLALSGGTDADESTSGARAVSVWSDPAFRLEGARHPSPVAWWASAMPR